MSFDVAKVLGKDSFSAAEADAILEIAYLTGVANGSFSRDELKSLRRLAHALAERTGATEPVLPLEELVERFDLANEGIDPQVRLAALAKVLTGDVARRAAYRVSYALSISDLESNEDEEELEADLATALGLRDELETLRNDVLGALDGEA